MPVEILRVILMTIKIQPLAPCRQDADYPASTSKTTWFLGRHPARVIAVQGAALVPRKGRQTAPAERPGSDACVITYGGMH